MWSYHYACRILLFYVTVHFSIFISMKFKPIRNSHLLAIVTIQLDIGEFDSCDTQSFLGRRKEPCGTIIGLDLMETLQETMFFFPMK